MTDEEVAVVKAGLRKYAGGPNYIVDVKGEHIVVYEGQGGCYQQVLRFTLTDEKPRRFFVERWCFLGSIDDWFPLGDGGLPKMVEKYCRHLGKESFFELM